MKVSGPMFSVDARGGIFGTIVFSIWRQINYIRELAIPTNPNSPRQQLIRAFLTTASRAWAVLTQGQRDNWDSVAAGITHTTQLGQSFSPTGIAFYVGLSIIAQDLGEVPIVEPPAVDNPAILADAAAVVGIGVAGDIDCSWTAGGGDWVDIWITRALSDGEHAQENLYRHQSYTDDVTAALVISGLLADRLYGVRLRSLLDSGQDGPYTSFEVRSKA